MTILYEERVIKMIAQFIGVDSMGFVNGKIYNLYSDIHVFGDKLCIFLHDKNSRAWCPYSNVDTILNN